MKKHYQIKTVFGTIDPSTDSVHITDKFQAGGNLTIVQGQWTTTVDSREITDPTGLGRWSGFTLTGKKDQAITIITGYRSCRGNPTRAGSRLHLSSRVRIFQSQRPQKPQSTKTIPAPPCRRNTSITTKRQCNSCNARCKQGTRSARQTCGMGEPP